MKRYFLRLAYNGAPFHGWQSQPNAVSVQQTLEEALVRITGTRVALTGAGRTDAGVNARVMYAHFDLENPPADMQRFRKSLDMLAGSAVSINEVISVHPDAHARFDAQERTYKYFITFEKSPFLASTACYSPAFLDVGKMNDAAYMLLRERDFTSFAKLHSDTRTNICDVRKAEWTGFMNPFGVPGVEFTISADRFLRNMVRAIVGTLVEVGRGKLTLDQFAEIIARRDRCAAGTSMPPQALFLWDIRYPYISSNT